MVVHEEHGVQGLPIHLCISGPSLLPGGILDLLLTSI